MKSCKVLGAAIALAILARSRRPSVFSSADGRHLYRRRFVKCVFTIKLVSGRDAGTIRWRLLEPGKTMHFLESRRTFRWRTDAYQDAEAFLTRLGKKSVRDTAN